MKSARDVEALREAIDARGFSYRQLGLIAECSHNTLYLLLQGKATSGARASRIARSLGYRVDELFVDDVLVYEQDGNKQAALT